MAVYLLCVSCTVAIRGELVGTGFDSAVVSVVWDRLAESAVTGDLGSSVDWGWVMGWVAVTEIPVVDVALPLL